MKLVENNNGESDVETCIRQTYTANVRGVSVGNCRPLCPSLPGYKHCVFTSKLGNKHQYSPLCPAITTSKLCY